MKNSLREKNNTNRTCAKYILSAIWTSFHLSMSVLTTLSALVRRINLFSFKQASQEKQSANYEKPSSGITIIG